MTYDIRALHVRSYDAVFGLHYCDHCGVAWPCRIGRQEAPRVHGEDANLPGWCDACGTRWPCRAETETSDAGR